MYSHRLTEYPDFFVKFVWIPSHIRNEGNESVDMLAKDSTTRLVLEDFPIPFSDFFRKFKLDARLETENKYKGPEYTQSTKIYFEIYSTKSLLNHGSMAKNVLENL